MLFIEILDKLILLKFFSGLKSPLIVLGNLRPAITPYLSCSCFAGIIFSGIFCSVSFIIQFSIEKPSKIGQKSG